MTSPIAKTLLLMTAATLVASALAPANHVVRKSDPRTGRVTNRPANVNGRVPIIMYHAIGDKEKYMVRSYSNFRNDLNRLYKMGFRPVTLAEYVDGKFNIPPGASPVVLTFDDSRESQFRVKKDGSPAPNSFVGVWQEFERTHPDFPVKGTFFILPNGPFGKKSTGKAKVKALLAWGCEIASHTYNHKFLNTLTDQEVMRELAVSKDWLTSIGANPRTMALPYGVNPKNRSLLEGFKYRGKFYKYDAVCLAGDTPARSPHDPKVNFLRLPRIEASPAGDGLDSWLDRIESNKVKPYVVP